MMQPRNSFSRQQSGVGLIELMVAMLIGLFLILGAVTVFNQSRNTYRTSESLARLHETARLAMDVVETDIRMANYWGMSNRADFITNRAGPSEAPPTEFTAQQATIEAKGQENTAKILERIKAQEKE